MSKVICLRCKGDPCVCHYVERLQSGAIDSKVTAVAKARMQEAHSPIASCPCPECYRVRLASWDVPTSTERKSS